MVSRSHSASLFVCIREVFSEELLFDGAGALSLSDGLISRSLEFSKVVQVDLVAEQTVFLAGEVSVFIHF